MERAHPENKGSELKDGTAASSLESEDLEALILQTHFKVLPSLARSVLWAFKALPPKEFVAFGSIHFLPVSKRPSLEELSLTLDCDVQELRQLIITARQKLKEINTAEGLPENPYLRLFIPEQTKNGCKPRPILPKAIKPYPETPEKIKNFRLQALAETLFSQRHYAMIYHEIFAPMDIVRDRHAIAQKLGYKMSGYKHALAENLKILRAATLLEPESFGLSDYLEMRIGKPKYKIRNHRQFADQEHFKNIDRKKINFSIPGVREIFDIACGENRDKDLPASQVFAFVVTRLYDAPFKLTFEDVAEQTGCALDTLMRTAHIRSHITEQLINAERAELSTHPVLGKNPAADLDDVRARTLLLRPKFQKDIKQLPTHLRNLSGLAITAFTPRLCYCFLRTDIPTLKKRHTKIADELGFNNADKSAQLATRARRIIAKFGDHGQSFTGQDLQALAPNSEHP